VLQAFGAQQDDVVFGCIDRFSAEPISARARVQIYAQLLYGPYLDREQKEIDKLSLYKDLVIPAAFDYANIPGLSKELQQKLTTVRPETIGQAVLIQGMTPAALSLLIFKVRKGSSALL
jgi:tRNA uridine 5-carboxymethylaminomethyl modification enzyme